MPAPYSLDLRTKSVSAYKKGTGTVEQVATVFGIGVATLSNYLRLGREKGSVTPKKATSGSKPTIRGKGLRLLKQQIEKRPDITLKELSHKYEKKLKIKVSTSMVSRALSSMSIRRKKKSHYAAEQDREDVKKNH